MARAVAGSGVSVRDSAGGQWAIVAATRGILRVATASLAAVNGLEGISVYTVFDGQVVDAGEVVARAKVTPLVIAETVVREVEEHCQRAGACLAVHPFERSPRCRGRAGQPRAKGPGPIRGGPPGEARLARRPARGDRVSRGGRRERSGKRSRSP